MAQVKHRENTFKVDLSGLPKRPSFEDIHKFVRECIGLNNDQILRLQMNHAQNCAHVKCIDLHTALNAVDQHNERHEIEISEKKFKVRLIMDDGGVEIKVHDLSENVSNEQICDYLKQYGEVLNIREVMWGENFAFKGVSSGIRIVKMVLKKHIRSFVTIQGEQTLITYRNQPQTCRHCTNLTHPGSTCVQNKKLLGQKADLEKRLKHAQKQSTVGQQTYADIVTDNSFVNALMPRFVRNTNNESNESMDIDIQPQTSASVLTESLPSAAPSEIVQQAECVDNNKAIEQNDAPAFSANPSTETAPDVEASNSKNESHAFEVNEFKTPKVLSAANQKLTISENESESGSENVHVHKKGPRTRTRAKKLKLNTERSISPEPNRV